MNTCPCFMCVFLLRDTLFNRRGWFINIELTANTVTHNTVTHSIVTHAWTELIQHTCVSGRHILAFLCLGMAVGTLALLYFKQQSPQWKTLKYKKCYIWGPTKRTFLQYWAIIRRQTCHLAEPLLGINNSDILLLGVYLWVYLWEDMTEKELWHWHWCLQVNFVDKWICKHGIQK